MKVVVQRVKSAKVDVDLETIGEIEKGILVLVGFQVTDDESVIEYIIDKLIGLRIFEDEAGKMNISVKDIGGGILLVPNFTLYGDCRKGKRPSFISAAKPEDARQLFEIFVSLFKERYNQVEVGKFQADMKVSLINDGPVTLILEKDIR